MVRKPKDMTGMIFKTVVPERVSGETKFHKTLVGAKSAFRPAPWGDLPKQIDISNETALVNWAEDHPAGQIFELINGQWVLLYDIPNPELLNLAYRKIAGQDPEINGWARDTRPWVTYEYVNEGK